MKKLFIYLVIVFLFLQNSCILGMFKRELAELQKQKDGTQQKTAIDVDAKIKKIKDVESKLIPLIKETKINKNSFYYPEIEKYFFNKIEDKNSAEITDGYVRHIVKTAEKKSIKFAKIEKRQRVFENASLGVLVVLFLLLIYSEALK